MSEIQLKPCPFCGGDAWLMPDDPRTPNEWAVACKDIQGCCIATSEYIKKEQAIKKWNTRFNDTSGELIGIMTGKI
jgi:hypothetical protein